MANKEDLPSNNNFKENYADKVDLVSSENMTEPIGLRLEQYTLKRRQEVLIVDLETAAGEPDRVTIFAGFSSSLMRATDFDPDVLVIAPDSKIISVDRLVSPYDPHNPQYIEFGLTIDAMENILKELNI